MDNTNEDFEAEVERLANRAIELIKKELQKKEPSVAAQTTDRGRLINSFVIWALNEACPRGNSELIEKRARLWSALPRRVGEKMRAERLLSSKKTNKAPSPQLSLA